MSFYAKSYIPVERVANNQIEFIMRFLIESISFLRRSPLSFFRIINIFACMIISLGIVDFHKIQFLYFLLKICPKLYTTIKSTGLTAPHISSNISTINKNI